MTLDKTLQKIIQRAEFDEETFWEFCNQLKEYTGIQFEYDKCGKFENARLLPIIVGLCEEVERLRWALEEWPEFMNMLESEPNDVGDFQQFTNMYYEIRSALSTSALEKLGGG